MESSEEEVEDNVSKKNVLVAETPLGVVVAEKRKSGGKKKNRSTAFTSASPIRNHSVSVIKLITVTRG